MGSGAAIIKDMCFYMGTEVYGGVYPQMKAGLVWVAQCCPKLR